jgi:predicted RNA-binding Zn-ribbon protein involved in translation (DUF1610 family)
MYPRTASVPAIDAIMVMCTYRNETPAEIAMDLCGQFLKRYGYSVDGWPSEPCIPEFLQYHVLARCAFERLAEMAGGAILVDGSKRILFCQVEQHSAVFARSAVCPSCGSVMVDFRPIQAGARVTCPSCGHAVTWRPQTV